MTFRTDWNFFSDVWNQVVDPAIRSFSDWFAGEQKKNPFYEATAPELAPYVPGLDEIEKISDTQRYWSDYKKNTGKSRLYPGIQTHAPNVADVQSALDWWKS